MSTKATIADWLGLAGGLTIALCFLRVAWVLWRPPRCIVHDFHYAPHHSTCNTRVFECSRCPERRSKPRWS